eukprot:COSAG02_NODE_1811_length_10794_cov_9.516784_7_plen_95_part_00
MIGLMKSSDQMRNTQSRTVHSQIDWLSTKKESASQSTVWEALFFFRHPARSILSTTCRLLYDLSLYPFQKHFWVQQNGTTFQYRLRKTLKRKAF